MQLIKSRHGKNFTKPKVIAEPRFANMLLGGGISHQSGQEIKAHVDFDFHDLTDEAVRYTVEMTPDEAIKIGKQLMEQGQSIKAQYERSIAAGKIVD